MVSGVGLYLPYTPTGRHLEAELHSQFQDFRLRGEWFRPVAPLMKLIEERGKPAGMGGDWSAASAQFTHTAPTCGDAARPGPRSGATRLTIDRMS
jgi:hypothetical protein